MNNHTIAYDEWAKQSYTKMAIKPRHITSIGWLRRYAFTFNEFIFSWTCVCVIDLHPKVTETNMFNYSVFDYRLVRIVGFFLLNNYTTEFGWINEGMENTNM